MSWMDGTRARLRLLLRRDAAEARMDEEIGLHIEMETGRLMREQGLDRHAARRQALVAFGGIDKHKEALRDDRGLAWLGGLRLDLKLGMRMLVKYPGLTLVGGLSLAFAICVGSAAFELLTQTLRPTLPLPDGDRLVGIVVRDAQSSGVEERIAYDFLVWRERLESVEDIGAFRTFHRNLIVEGHAGEPVSVAAISASGFRVAGIAPLLGRTLLEDDERPGAPGVVVIGHGIWERHFGGDPVAVGATVTLGGEPFTVVGVMPEDFGFPVSQEAWLPLRLEPAGYEPRDGPALQVFGKLAESQSTEQAQAELETLGRALAAEHPRTHEHLRPRVTPYAMAVLGMFMTFTTPGELELSSIASLLHASMNVPLVLFVVLVCGNVALLIFARAASREAELVIRTALGASRRRIVLQLFAEALVLGGIAAVAGLAATAWAGEWALNAVLGGLDPGGRLPFWFEPALSPPTLIYAAVLTLLCAVIAGVVPALKVTRGLANRLRQAGAGGGGFRFGGLWTAVIVAQVAFTIPFPVTVLAVRMEASAISSVETGLAEQEFLTLRLQLDREAWSGTTADTSESAYGAKFRQVVEELQRRLAAQPGVRGVTFANRLPRMYHPYQLIEMDEGGAAPLDPRWPAYRVSSARVDVDFFDVLNVPILAGRAFRPADLESSARAVIVNQSFVDLVLGGRNPIGRRLRYTQFDDGDEPPSAEKEPWYEIVGVVRDLAMAYGNDPKVAGFYHPSAAGAAGPVRLAAHVGGSAASIMPRVRAIADEVDPALRLYDVMPLSEVIESEMRFYAFWTWFLVVACGVALVLSLAGIYAVMAFTVAQRTREIGIRIALGADRRRIVGAIFRRPLIQVGAGIGAGGVLMLGLVLLGDGFFTFTSIALLMAYLMVMTGVCLVAAVVPTRRALAVEPSEALRSD